MHIRRLAACGLLAPVVAVPVPGAAKPMASGALLPGPPVDIVGPSFDDWLARDGDHRPKATVSPEGA